MSENPRLKNENQTLNSAPERIAELLTLATEQLDTKTVETLHRSRQAALARQAPQIRVSSLATAHGIHWQLPHSVRHLTAALLIIMIVGGASYWQHHWKHEKMAHLDVAILTDDMPMEVFVDHLSE